MAFFEGKGFDEFTKAVQGHRDLLNKAFDELIDAGSQVIVESWKQSIRNHNLIDTGDMLESIVAEPEKAGSTTYKIYPKGEDRKGTRNAEKAFISHYGRKKQQATHFVDEAETAAEKPAVEAMEKVWEKYLQEG